MKPRLVDHMFQTPTIVPQTVQVKQPVIIVKPTNYTPLFINIFSIIIMVFGGYCLYYRKITREKNKKEHIQTIQNLYKGINLK